MDKFGDSGIDTPKFTPSFQLSAHSQSLHKIIIIINILGKFGSEGLLSTANAVATERFFLHQVRIAKVAPPLVCAEVGLETVFCDVW
jgi:hypothetical protein